jgi:cysteine desulfurase
MTLKNNRLGVYADYNATTPLCDNVLKEMQAYKSMFGNVSSGHVFGQTMQSMYDQAVDTLKHYMGASTYSFFSCSSATEASNWFMYSLLNKVEGCPRVIITAIEHPCVAMPLQRYHQDGIIDLQVCPVDKHGQVIIDAFESLLTDNTLFVSIIMANNEIGTIQPMGTLTALAHKVGAVVMSDCVQACGKTPVDLEALGIDAAIVSSHKCYAPTGCGGIFIKDSTLLKAWILGGTQQEQLRAGTINVMGTVLFAKGVEYCINATHEDIGGWVSELKRACPAIELIASPQQKNQLWNTVSIAIPGALSHDLMMQCDVEGVAVGTGSACATGAVEVSSVVLALGLPIEMAAGVIRLSFGVPTTKRELEIVCDIVKKILTK